MRFYPRRFGAIGGSRSAWPLLFVLLSLLIASLRADSPETGSPSSVDTSPEPEGDSWSWSAGGWFSLGGWSSSWRSMVSGTRTMFRWRFGNVPPETDGSETEEEEAVTETAPDDEEGRRRCQQLTIESCRGLGYESTWVPNLLSHESQDIARVELEQYSSLLRVNCSADMAFFLCALHAPKCLEEGGEGEKLPPCRPMCERIKSRCNVVMERFEYTWPSIFECKKYPDPLQSHCMGQ